MLADGRLVVAGGIQEGNLATNFLDPTDGLHKGHPLGSRSTWIFETNTK